MTYNGEIGRNQMRKISIKKYLGVLGLSILCVCSTLAGIKTYTSPQRVYADNDKEYILSGFSLFDKIDTGANVRYADYDKNDQRGNEPYILLQSKYLAKITPASDTNGAFVWTAPADGKVFSKEVLIDYDVDANKNCDGGRYAVVKVPAAEDGIIADGTVLEPIYQDENKTFWNDIPYSKESGEPGKTDIAVTIGSREAPVDMKDGESVMIIVNAGVNENNNYDCFRCKKFIVEYKFGDGSIKDYSLTRTLNDAEEKTLDKIYENAAAEGFGFYSFKVNETDSVNPATDTNELPIALNGSSFWLKELINPEKNGLWHSEKSSNYNVAVNGSTAKIAPSADNACITWTAPSDGVVGIKRLFLEVSYKSNNKAEDFKLSDGRTLAEDGANGIKYLFLYADKSGNATVYRSLIGNGGWNVLEWAANKSEADAKRVDRTDLPSVEMKKGDEIVLIVDRNENSRYDATLLQLRLQYKNEKGKIAFSEIYPGSKSILEQGTDNFRFYTSTTANASLDITSPDTYKFGTIVETTAPWVKNARGSYNGYGLSCWFNSKTSYLQPQTPSDEQKAAGYYSPRYLQIHPDFGAAPAYSFAPDFDCAVQITEAWLQKLAGDSDGVRVAFIYKTKDENGNIGYYSIKGQQWTILPGSADKSVTHTFTDFPVVDMKDGDELMVVFENNKTMDYDSVNSRVTLSVFEKSTGNLTGHNFENDLTLYCDGSDPVVGFWKFYSLKFSGDFSNIEIGGPENITFKKADFTAKELGQSLTGGYESLTDSDLKLSWAKGSVSLVPGLTEAVVLKYTVKEKGRVAIDAGSYIRVFNDGSSDGIRFRVLKNDEIVYPVDGGWRGYRNDLTNYIKGFPVISVENGDEIRFVFDSCGNISADESKVEMILNFAADGETYTSTAVLSDGISLTQGKDGWSFESIVFNGETDSDVFEIKLNAGDSSGCNSRVSGIGGVSLALILAITCVARIGVRRKDKKGRKR